LKDLLCEVYNELLRMEEKELDKFFFWFCKINLHFF
jgi:hypothetical protein